MNIEETYKGQWSSDPALLKSLLDVGMTIVMGFNLSRFAVAEAFKAPSGDAYYVPELVMERKWELNNWEGLRFLDPRPRALEPSPLEWRQDIDNSKCESAKSGNDWKFYASREGFAHVYFLGSCIFFANKGSMDEAKAAINEWRVNHLKSIIGGK